MSVPRRATPPSFTYQQVQRDAGGIRIPPWDLIEQGDFVIPDDVDALDDPPFIGGGNKSVIGVESTDSQNFSIKFEYGTLVGGSFVVDYEYTKTKDANLTGDNDYFIRIDPVRDRVKVTITDESSAAQNKIRGGLHTA